MKTPLVFVLTAFVTLSAFAQTNSAQVATNKTLDSGALAKARKEVAGMVNRYFDTMLDQIDGSKSIQQKNPIKLGTEAYPMEIKLEAFLAKGENFTENFHLHIVNDAPEWMLLNYNRFLLKYDGSLKELSKTEVHSSVISGDHVLEQVSIDFTIDELQKIITAKNVEGRIGLMGFTLPPEKRAEWQALVNYFYIRRGEDKRSHLTKTATNSFRVTTTNGATK